MDDELFRDARDEIIRLEGALAKQQAFASDVMSAFQ